MCESHRSSVPETLIRRYIDAGSFAGAALLVARGGRLLIEHYAGQAAPGLPAGPATLWPIASISKVYTAAMIMRLVELGELTLNTLVCQVLPAFQGAGREHIRLRHLLTHTAGLIYESPEMEARLAARTPMPALIAEALEARPQSRPGTALAYADYHYLLAGHMAEVATGRPYARLVQSLVLEPAGLHATFLPPDPADHGRIARVRGVLAEGSEGAMYNSPYALGLAHPAFGVVATAADLLRFALHFAPGGPRIHCETTVRAMTSDQTGGVPGRHPSMQGFGEGARMSWGLGWALQTAELPALFSELLSFRCFGHGGASGCQLVIDPELDLVVSIITNTHLRTGRELWYTRLQSIINAAVARTEEMTG
jgi:CubicO group peptidase (beta-lactamase class C family)